jgi:hypothetical protein
MKSIIKLISVLNFALLSIGSKDPIINTSIQNGKNKVNNILHSNVISGEKNTDIPIENINNIKLLNINQNNINENVNNEDILYKDYPGIPCFNLENKYCTINFSEIGPLTYNSFQNCFIYYPFAGITNKSDNKEKINFDLNAFLGCIINKQLFGYVQYVNIKGSTNNLTTDTLTLPKYIELKQGENILQHNNISLNIKLSDCNDVWTVKANDDQINCHTTPIALSTDGHCGFIDDKMVICKNQCCSENGRCGTTTEFCNNTCQPFGICGDLKSTLLERDISTDGRCGPANGKSCPGKECCSSDGYCGTTPDHCDIGCRLPFGVCSNYFYVASKWAYMSYKDSFINSDANVNIESQDTDNFKILN